MGTSCAVGKCHAEGQHWSAAPKSKSFISLLLLIIIIRHHTVSAQATINLEVEGTVAAALAGTAEVEVVVDTTVEGPETAVAVHRVLDAGVKAAWEEDSIVPVYSP